MFVMLDILPDMLYLSCLVCCIFVCLVRYFVFVFILPGILWAPSNGWSAVQILSCPKGFLYLERLFCICIYVIMIGLNQGPKEVQTNDLIVIEIRNINMAMILITLINISTTSRCWCYPRAPLKPKFEYVVVATALDHLETIKIYHRCYLHEHIKTLKS